LTNICNNFRHKITKFAAPSFILVASRQWYEETRYCRIART